MTRSAVGLGRKGGRFGLTAALSSNVKTSAPGARTRVEFRLAYVVAGAGLSGWLAERIAAPTVSGHVKRTLQQLDRLVEHEQLRAGAAARRRTATGR